MSRVHHSFAHPLELHKIQTQLPPTPSRGIQSHPEGLAVLQPCSPELNTSLLPSSSSESLHGQIRMNPAVQPNSQQDNDDKP